MIEFPPVGSLPEERATALRDIGNALQADSPADTVACAYGVGREVLMWSDDSDGRLFDIASLTKPLFTATSVLVHVAPHLSSDGSLADLVPDLPLSVGRLRVRDLMTHSAGLPAELPRARRPVEVIDWLARYLEARASAEGRVVYSDPSYWLLGYAISTWAQSPLSDVFTKLPTSLCDEFAFGSAPAHQTVPVGPEMSGTRLPHDPAARRLGLSGHAGAFGTLAGIVHAVTTWLDSQWIPQPLATAAVTCQTHPTPGGHRSLAWTLIGDPFHSVAHDWPTTTLCHTGFTGVCVALDPVSNWWGIYLSNALPIDKDATPVLKARRLFYAQAAQHLAEAATAPPDDHLLKKEDNNA